MNSSNQTGEKSNRKTGAMETLREELELTDYGRKRRKLTQAQRKKHTLQRKELERKDALELAVRFDDAATASVGNHRKRLRGKNVAFKDSFVRGSFIFGEINDLDEDQAEQELRNLLQEDGILPGESGYDTLSIMEDKEAMAMGDNEEEEESDVEMIDEERDQDLSSKITCKLSSEGKSKEPKKKPNRSRHMYQLKNLKSYRLALRHGDALGAHARGLNKTAIGTLQEIATMIPDAPQVYSSLGLVYENMLFDKVDPIVSQNSEGMMESNDTVMSESQDIERRIEIATKAYGSYHIAALLCKKDFTLWLRCGDMALKIAELHSTAFAILSKDRVHQYIPPSASVTSSEQRSSMSLSNHQIERKKWLLEARDDYQVADNLKPPGITVPAKLAHAQMQLGNLSEALTVLTDLKNQVEATIKTKKKNILIDKTDGVRERSELERSHTAWMLYADLMLRIGYECSQWNSGLRQIENQTFRRWLRKYSMSFDWKERRLQALCLAFEAAAGSTSGRNMVSWVQDRATKKPSSSTTVWFAETDDSTKKLHDDEYDGHDVDTEDKSHPWEDSQSMIPRSIAEATDETWDKTDVEERKNSLTAAQGDREVIDDAEDCKTSTQYKMTPLEDSCPSNLRKIAPNKTNHVELNEPSITLHNLSTVIDDFSVFLIERELLIQNNRNELIRFDQETSSMLLTETFPSADDRLATRTALVRKHKEAVLKFVGDYHARQAPNMPLDVDSVPLPMSASFATVFKIAYELMRLCLDMELYVGSKIAAEATLTYFRERIARRSARLKSLDDCRKRLSTESTPFEVQSETYDEIDGSSVNSDENEFYLSDDDEFDNNTHIFSIQGLPPHLQAMYGLSLLCVNSHSFLAQKLLYDSLENIQDATIEIMSDCLDTRLFTEQSWRTFHHRLTQPFNKMGLITLVASHVHKMEMVQESVQSLSSLFQRYLLAYEQNRPENETFTVFSNSDYLMILLSYLKMDTFRAREMLLSSIVGPHEQTGWNILHSVIEKLTSLKANLIQRSDFKFTLSALWIETLNVISEILSIAVARSKLSPITHSVQYDFLSRACLLVSWLSQVPISIDSDSTETINAPINEGLPFADEWQINPHRDLSRLVHNLCVSCSVSAFSGWEKEEFKLQLMKFRADKNFFGVTLSECRVSGVLADDIVQQLTALWIEIGQIIPSKSLNFSELLSKFQETEWYMDVIRRRDAFYNTQIDHYGEKFALIILLHFSNLCLQLSKSSQTSKQDSENMLKYALSILLPATQFGLNQTIWNSKIGLKSTEQELDEWEKWLGRNLVFTMVSSRNEPEKSYVPKNRSHFPRPPTAVNDSDSAAMYKVDLENSPFVDMVEIPTDWLHSEWMDSVEDSSVTDQMDSSLQKSVAAMNALDSAMEQLKNCSTVISLQKLSLQIAAALLNVATSVFCYNPFVCFHHAAIFASQGSKGGNDDDLFKKILPLQDKCTPREALGILGRADCLRAIHFIDEAMFLCSYVAGVLSLHRQGGKNIRFTNSQWKVVGIHLYTCSLAMDGSIFSLMDSLTRNKTLLSWRKEVQDELEEAKKNAIAVRKYYGVTSPVSGIDSAIAIDNSLNAGENNDLENQLMDGIEVVPL